MFKGTLTALVTPFKNGEVDGHALRDLVAWQIQQGIHGLVACGTTGEASALSREEQLGVIRQVVEEAKGKVPVIAGTGTNNTQKTVEFSREAMRLKVDGVLVVTPYYIKPTQKGLLLHFQEVAKLGVPVVAYNVPGRTGVSLTAETVGALSRINNIVALKEASGDMKLDSFMIGSAQESFALLSGDDYTYLPLLSIGGRGCISVVSNVAPAEMAELYNLWAQGKPEEAREIHNRLFPLMDALFLESNPIPVKAAMAALGHCTGEIRPPLTQLSEQHRPKLEQALSGCGLKRR